MVPAPPVRRVYAQAHSTGDSVPNTLVATLTAEDGALAVLQSTWLVPDAAPSNLAGPPAGPLDLWGTIDAQLEVVGTSQVGKVDLMSGGLSLWDDSAVRTPDTGLWPEVHGRVSGALREELSTFLDCVRQEALAPGAAGYWSHGGSPRGSYSPLVPGRRGRPATGGRMRSTLDAADLGQAGGGATGLGISHALDPNVYLLSGGEELALVDAVPVWGEDRILDNVRSLGYEPERIGHIFPTHAHADHAGGAASLVERLGAQVYLSELERRGL